ncbi:hypothetical protein [Archangium sp.]|uniref:hypothetical protein n=1 Tax=Archangium sp. TaxID=1872627 RepID=UPI002D4856DB|nr:hypothetical protein [Archangium sp.]HYO57527.1 hypothetical protein [Archangium sp.]
MKRAAVARDALRDTWPSCNMNNGATDCTLGPAPALVAIRGWKRPWKWRQESAMAF